jgi:hypothetical protein
MAVRISNEERRKSEQFKRRTGLTGFRKLGDVTKRAGLRAGHL